MSNNQLTTLLPLCLEEGERTLYRCKKVLARHNHVQYLCSGYKGSITFNEWPVTMEYLQVLDLSFNRLTSIPNLKSMPNLHTLSLMHNLIRPPVAQLADGISLQVLELQENMLDWSPSEFENEVVVLQKLAKLREINLSDNPFCESAKHYELTVIRIISDAQRGMRHRISAPILEKVNGERLTKQRRALALSASLMESGVCWQRAHAAPLRKRRGVS